MLVHKDSTVIRNRGRNSKGSGLLNKLIDKLPFEAHIPGYRLEYFKIILISFLHCNLYL